MAEVEAPNQEQTEQQDEGATAPSFLDSLYPSEESQEVEETVETEEETTSEVETEDVEASEEEEEVISSFSQLLEQQEWDEEWFQNLKVPVKVDGKPAEATWKEVVASYQMQEAAQHRLEEAKTQAQAIKQEVSQERESVKTELGTAAAMVQLAEQLFNQDISDANLAKLREEDEQAYLVAKDKFSERRQALEQVKQHLRQNLQSAFQPKEPDPQVFEKERTALIEKAPALESPEARNELASYLLSQEFSQEELGSVADHRLFLLAHKARLYDASQEKVKAAEKKVAKIPKVMKPGAAQQKAPDKPKDAASILYG